MSLKNKYIILTLVITVIFVCGTIVKHFVQKDKPLDMIESKLKVKLPSSSKVLNFQYDSNGDFFGAKILVVNQSVEDIKKQINGFFKGEAPEQVTKELPNFENVYSWWDLDKQSIEAYYKTFVSSEKKWFKYTPKSHVVWAFISKDKSGQYHLYISY